MDGTPVLYLDRSHRGLLTFPAATDKRLALLALLQLGRDAVSLGNKGLSLERIDGVPAMESGLGPLLREAGFVQGFRGFTRRPERAEAMAHA